VEAALEQKIAQTCLEGAVNTYDEGIKEENIVGI
jgi:hypothetical protein